MSAIDPLYLTHQGMSKILFARKLRKKMTNAEKILWDVLRDRRCENCKFRRQVPLGIFIVDFCSMEHRLIIEIDGGIHDKKIEYDEERQQLLTQAGFRVLRFKNEEIEQDLSSVMQRIRNEIRSV